jgi:hypothetical protein
MTNISSNMRQMKVNDATFYANVNDKTITAKAKKLDTDLSSKDEVIITGRGSQIEVLGSGDGLAVFDEFDCNLKAKLRGNTLVLTDPTSNPTERNAEHVSIELPGILEGLDRYLPQIDSILEQASLSGICGIAVATCLKDNSQQVSRITIRSANADGNPENELLTNIHFKEDRLEIFDNKADGKGWLQR